MALLPWSPKAALLGLWSQIISRVIGRGEGDFSDFYEQAVRLESDLQFFGAEEIWLTFSQFPVWRQYGRPEGPT